MEGTAASVDKDDRLALFITVGVAGIVAIAAIVTGISRLAEVIPGRDVPIPISLGEQEAQLPLGPDGSPVPVDLTTGIVTVADPGSVTMAVAIAEPVITTLGVVAGAALAAVILLRLARGTAFTTRSHLLAYVLAGITLVVGVAADALRGLAASTALIDLGGDVSYGFSVSLGPVVAALAITAVGVALEAAHRLNKDTEGLV